MGSQLTKTSSSSTTSSSSSSSYYQFYHQRQNQQQQQQQSLSYCNSLRSSPINTAQQQRQQHNQKNRSIPKNIVVVNSGPTNKDFDTQNNNKKLPPEPFIKPLIPIGQLSSNFFITVDQPRLSVLPFVEIGKIFEQNLKQSAELISNEQQKLIEHIRLFDQQSLKLSQKYIQDKQRRFNKAVDNFGKFDEIRFLVDRCENDIEQLLTLFNKLNSALPESLCLENFQSPC